MEHIQEKHSVSDKSVLLYCIGCNPSNDGKRVRRYNLDESTMNDNQIAQNYTE